MREMPALFTAARKFILSPDQTFIMHACNCELRLGGCFSRDIWHNLSLVGINLLL